ncbi:hypothetical protein PIB30_045102 [Stylosanthes scabra]|uniref:Uncharacterized protein n=1 Tax=Stylosanthes scabra TaxID=79078 RepID=A0ABU6ZET3_9FABA|nr:hypothetical protein [Stylosanthes scabra]
MENDEFIAPTLVASTFLAKSLARSRDRNGRAAQRRKSNSLFFRHFRLVFRSFPDALVRHRPHCRLRLAVLSPTSTASSPAAAARALTRRLKLPCQPLLLSLRYHSSHWICLIIHGSDSATCRKPCNLIAVGVACVIHGAGRAKCRLLGACPRPGFDPPAQPVFATRDASSALTHFLPPPDAATCPNLLTWPLTWHFFVGPSLRFFG